MKHVRNRLKQLALERGAADLRYYGVRQIARESGASRTVVDRLCVWLDCQPGDLLKLEEDVNG